MRKPSQTSLSRPAKSSRSPPPDASPPEAASKPAGGRADARRNRERLIEVAHEVFTERGADASLDEIARLAGVGIGTLYRHFPTRDDLLVATLEGRLTSLGHKARVLAEASSPSEALDVWLRAYLRHATTYRGLASSLPATLGCMSVACDQAQAGGAALLARAQAAGEIRLDIDFADIRDMVTAVAFAAQQSPDSPARTRRLLSLVLDGLRPPRPADPASGLGTPPPNSLTPAPGRNPAPHRRHLDATPCRDGPLAPHPASRSLGPLMAAVALRFLGSARFRSPPYPAVLAVSPRGDFLVVAALREAWILRYETGELIGKIPLQSTSSLLLTFKAEGDRVLIGSLRSPALLCDLASATVVDTQPGLGMSAIALAADGRRALVAFDRVLTWWHLDRKERGPRLRRHRGMTHALALRAGDTEAVVVGENKVFLHDLERSLVVEIAHVHVSHTPITLSPDAATMAWAESGRIVLRATQPGAIERSAPVAWVHHLFFSSDSRYLLCTSMAGLTVLDVQSAGLVHHHPGWTPAVAASTPDGSSLVTIARSRVSGHVPPFARGIEIHQLDSSLPVGGVEGHEYAIQQLVFRPDGRTLLVTDESPTLRLWDRQTSAQRPHRWGGRPVIGIEISPDGRHALVRYSQGTSWFLWDLMADREIAELTSPVPYGTSQVSWSLDGRTVHGWHPHLIPQWSIPDGTLIATTVPPPLAHPPLYFVAHHQLGALTPDGPRLWTPGAPSGPLALKTGLPAWEHVFAVHPGGRTLATRSVHDRIHEWDTTTGALLRTVPDILTAFPCLAFSRDGSLLATSSIQEGQGPRVRVLDWPSGAALATLDLPWPGERVTALAFAPDDDSLLIGAAQGLIARVAASEFQQNLGTVI